MDHRIIRAKLDMLKNLAVEESRPVTPWRGRAAHHRRLGEYEYLDEWHSVPDTSRWPALQTVFLRGTVEVPQEWPVELTCLTFDFENLEGLLSLGERPWAGLDFGHHRVPVPTPGVHELLIEFQSVPGAWCQPGLRSSEGVFRGGQLVLLDPEVEAAWYDLRFAFETMNAISDGRRKALLSAAVEDAMVAFDLSCSRERTVRELSEAREVLADRISGIGRDPEGGKLFLTGHTHIDTAWLWPLKETVRKCGRTFSTACRLMERYPDFHFACSQAQLFAYTKQQYPALYDEIKRWVADGRWETTGGMWVEADANVISGESMIRQILYGLAFFREEFGTQPTLCWLPDVFGYNGNMPQILSGCGLQSFWTWKLHWQSRNPFPHHLFWWEGIDGSKVLAHIPKLGGGGYNGTPNPEQLTRSWDAYLQKGGYPEQLFPFGYGDGGGGVNDEMMELANRAADYPGIPGCRQGTPERFFADVWAANPALPTWVGELYLETHRGTYTTQGRTKRGNRLCELMLRDAEIWGTVEKRLREDTGTPSDLANLALCLRQEWETVLLHQFHDILPGSSIGEVYEDTAADHGNVLARVRSLRDGAMGKLAKGVETADRFRVFNSMSWDREDVVTVSVPEPGESVFAVSDGQKLPAQVIDRSGGKAEIAVRLRVPSLGAASLEIRKGESVPAAVRAQGRTLENEFYCLEINEDGSLGRLFDKRAEREVIPEGETANRLQLFQDGPEHEAAWNVHATYVKREYPWEGAHSVEITEQGPVRAVARVTRSHRDTSLVQDIILQAGLPRLDFRTHVDWHEKQTMLKVAFPVGVHASHATFEIQFGALERPTHCNTAWDAEKFEVCGQRWADLSEGGFGVSLLNDCKYGHDVLGNVLRLTLLRGTEFPDPDADQGAHDFTYSLLPHRGDWREGETVRRAAELNAPLVAVPTIAEEDAISYLRLDGPAALETLKPAEDGDGVIVRLYEPNGSRGRVTVKTLLPFSEVIRCNLVERNEGSIPSGDGAFSFNLKPFQICTFRLK